MKNAKSKKNEAFDEEKEWGKVFALIKKLFAELPPDEPCEDEFENDNEHSGNANNSNSSKNSKSQKDSNATKCVCATDETEDKNYYDDYCCDAYYKKYDAVDRRKNRKYKNKARKYCVA